MPTTPARSAGRPRNVWQLEGRIAAGELATLVLDVAPNKEPIVLPFDKLCATLRGAVQIADKRRALQVVVLNIDCSRTLALRLVDAVPELAVVCWTTPTESRCAREFLEAFYAEIVAPVATSPIKVYSKHAIAHHLLPVQLAFTSGQEALNAHHCELWRACQTMGAPAPAPAPCPSLVLGTEWAGERPQLPPPPSSARLLDAVDAGRAATTAAAMAAAIPVHIDRNGAIEIRPGNTPAPPRARDVDVQPARVMDSALSSAAAPAYPAPAELPAPRARGPASVHVDRSGAISITPSGAARAAPAQSTPMLASGGGDATMQWLAAFTAQSAKETHAALARNAALDIQLRAANAMSAPDIAPLARLDGSSRARVPLPVVASAVGTATMRPAEATPAPAPLAQSRVQVHVSRRGSVDVTPAPPMASRARPRLESPPSPLRPVVAISSRTSFAFAPSTAPSSTPLHRANASLYSPPSVSQNFAPRRPYGAPPAPAAASLEESAKRAQRLAAMLGTPAR